MALTKLAVLLGTLTSAVYAHGTVSGIIVDGTYYTGYNPAFQWSTPKPVLIAWSVPDDLDNGFVAPAAFGTADVDCHRVATPGQAAAPIKAGGKVSFQWTPWPTSHKGPIIDYLANCNGPCETVDKTTLKWFKIDQGALLSGNNPGTWVTDTMIANNNTWTVQIPSDIATGNYVLRHEIIALHAAGQANGAQDYPQCINLAITGTGTAKPAGVLGTDLYKATDPGIKFDLYGSFSTYTIPGPALYTGAAVIQQALPAKPTASATGVYTVFKA